MLRVDLSDNCEKEHTVLEDKIFIEDSIIENNENEGSVRFVML